MIDFEDLMGDQPDHEREELVEEATSCPAPVERPATVAQTPRGGLEVRSRREYVIGPGPKRSAGERSVSFGDEDR